VKAALEERFLVRSVHPFVVAGTALGEDVGAVGAASLVLDHTFSPNPSVLLLGPALTSSTQTSSTQTTSAAQIGSTLVGVGSVQFGSAERVMR
jgi:hypothetical protein